MTVIDCPLLWVLPTLLAMSPSAAAASDSNARAEVVYHTVFLDNDPRRWAEAPITVSVQPETLRLIPHRTASFSMIALSCDRVRSDGRLAKCKVSGDPPSNQLNKIGRGAARDIRIDPDFARSIQGKVRFISIQLRVSNSAAPARNGPCWPPTCHLIPLPPPPPPVLPNR